MEVIVPSPAMEFDFSSGRSTPFVLSAPPTPKRFGDYYFSAPTSPSRMAELYREFEEFSRNDPGGDNDESSLSMIPFGLEEKPGQPESPKGERDDQVDFVFNFREDMEKALLSAEDLFDDGKIRPMRPPPRIQLPDKYKYSSKEEAGAQSPVPFPRSSAWRGKRAITEAQDTIEKNRKNQCEQERGRGLTTGSGSGRRGTRSLSPYRVSSYPWEEEEKEKELLRKANNSSKQPSSSNSSLTSSKGSRSGSKKWRLKDFLVFRSASEGRATDKDSFRKYVSMFRRQDATRDLSCCSTIPDTPTRSVPKRQSDTVSACKLHYTVDKAVSNDLKKKTFLPYKQGIIARLFMP